MTRITARLAGATKVEVSNGRHTWTADEPVAAGGTDAGPNPYELLMSALAACTCITIALYCRHKGIELRGISAALEFSNVHADDCEDCDDDASGFIERVSSHVTIEGDFDVAQKRRLAQIAMRCPVHKTLVHGVTIQDSADFA